MTSTKKIIIATVYNSENCGSYLQAWSLFQVLKFRGYDVAFLKRNSKHTSHSFGLHLINASKDIIKLRFSHAIAVIKEWFVFNRLQKQFKIARKGGAFYKEASLQIIGSDTLWNFETAYFKDMAQTYLGQAFFPKPSVTYAVSAANTSSELFISVYKENNNNKGIRKYLVRDTHTAELVRSVTGETPHIVCDPTMLLSPKGFNTLEATKPPIDRYLLIYCFGNIAIMKDAIISYAKQRGLKTVSFLTKREWCDYSVEEDPRLMVTYYKYAACVVSNTFHGTAFSIIYEKPFAVFDEGKNKVKELLQMYKQEKRLISAPESLKKSLDCDITDDDIQTFNIIKEKSLTLLFNTVSNELDRKV